MYKVINTTMKWNVEKKWKSKYKNNEKWTDNNIGAKGAAKISESLMTNTTLTTLNLSCDDNIMKNKQE